MTAVRHKVRKVAAFLLFLHQISNQSRKIAANVFLAEAPAGKKKLFATFSLFFVLFRKFQLEINQVWFSKLAR